MLAKLYSATDRVVGSTQVQMPLNDGSGRFLAWATVADYVTDSATMSTIVQDAIDTIEVETWQLLAQLDIDGKTAAYTTWAGTLTNKRAAVLARSPKLSNAWVPLRNGVAAGNLRSALGLTKIQYQKLWTDAAALQAD